MKKLIISIIAALTIGTASCAITAEEAIASKNIYTMEKYCYENKISLYTFIFMMDKFDRNDYRTIYNSITNRHCYSHAFPILYIRHVRKSDSAIEAYNYAKENLYSLDKINIDSVYKNLKKTSKCYFTSNYYDHLFAINDLFNGFMTLNTNICQKTDVCLYFYSISNDKKYIDMIDYNNLLNKKLYSCALDYAIAINDIDKMIDILLVIPDVTSIQANAIIAPVNSVEASYRKEDIINGLENINSRCTIKLYDDQKTWEPILAKIRAMINLRK